MWSVAQSVQGGLLRQRIPFIVILPVLPIGALVLLRLKLPVASYLSTSTVINVE